ncbi:MAG: FxsA family protein [Gammaproteobacteria bacterium]|jgi:UPF0716 protein FxsA|nr:FxsA family protein [Gammaproteobacteria bacterium]
MNPITILFFLFLAIPLLEIYLLIQVGGVIGAPWTIFLVVFTAVLGAWLLRIQGFSTLRRIQQTLNQGGLPAVELMEGAVLLMAGALLLTPGFFTDTIGFICLVPVLRRTIIVHLMRRFFTPRQPGHPPHVDDQPPPRPNHPHQTHTIEGEYTREDE